jgi:hypothetical protein
MPLPANHLVRDARDVCHTFGLIVAISRYQTDSESPEAPMHHCYKSS